MSKKLSAGITSFFFRFMLLISMFVFDVSSSSFFNSSFFYGAGFGSGTIAFCTSFYTPETTGFLLI